MKKIKLLVLTPILALCACTPETHLGVYEFMLGSTEDNKVGVSIELKDNDYYIEQEVKGKEFKAVLATGAITVRENFSFDGSEELNEAFETLFNAFFSDGLTGYYNIIEDSEYETSYGKRLALGAHITSEDFEEPLGFEIPPEILEYVIVSYCDNKTITLQLPVSVTDVQHQLAWYGIYFNINGGTTFAELDENLLPGKKGEARFGTHPLVGKDEEEKDVDQVAEMNYNFSYEFSNTTVYKSLVDTTVIGKISYVYEQSNYIYKFEPAEDYTLPEGNQITCALKYKKDGEFSESKLTTLTIDKTWYNKVTQVENASGIIALEDYETTFFQQPFTFRNFHDIKLGLTKK